ncbi:ABC transporter ATP-binding protein/permease [Patescibacteria group bacterium]|nr:ABC transporter ATP-binding protein/permease [Patescibacteria group bacterium]
MPFKNNSIIYLARQMWRFSKGNRKNVILFIGMFVISNSISFFEPLVFALILNTVQDHGLNDESLPLILSYAVLFIAIEVGFWAFHGPARFIEEKNAFLMEANYKKYLLEGTMNLPAQWHTDHHSGDTIDKIEKGAKSLREYASETFQMIDNVIRFVGSYLALTYFNLHAGYIVIVMVLLTLTMIVKFDRRLVPRYHRLYRAENKISAKVFDTISNITTVIILRIEKLVAKAIMKKIMQPLRLFERTRKIDETKWFLTSMASVLMVFLVLVTYLYSHYRTGTVIMIGTVYVLYGYVERINGLFYRFAYQYSDIVRQATAVRNAETISQEFVTKDTDQLINLGGHWREINIKSLNFSYHTREGADLHLDDVALSIGRNERIALIGESGSGKTTLLKVIRDLYQPQNISLHIDNTPLEDGFSAISSDIALIPQDPELFNTTIEDNITMGAERSLEEVKKFTDLACFTEVVKGLPRGFNSSVEEKGVNLSTGEKQRLALARGLLACEEKSIVLLDEPTSSVDSKNELQIYQNIFTAFPAKTILSAIHRLHLLPLFDKIIFFKDGKIVARGTFTELLEKSMEFQETWRRYNETKKEDIG